LPPFIPKLIRQLFSTLLFAEDVREVQPTVRCAPALLLATAHTLQRRAWIAVSGTDASDAHQIGEASSAQASAPSVAMNVPLSLFEAGKNFATMRSEVQALFRNSSRFLELALHSSPRNPILLVGKLYHRMCAS
jgi:hypothetical protein